MPHLVRRLHMDKDEIQILKRRQGSLRLAAVIGIYIAGDPFHSQRLQSGIDTDAVEEIYRGDHSAPESVSIRKLHHLRHPALTPQPDGIGRSLSLPLSGLINRMGRQDDLSPTHHVNGGPSPRPRGQVSVALLSGDVVGWRGLHLRDTIAPDEEMAITYSRKELELIISQGILQ